MVHIRHKETEDTLHTVESDTLRGAELSGLALYSADLERADLQDANLHRTSLLGANLRRARLQSANLREATLYGADLWGASLRGADLRGADLRGANLDQANLSGTSLTGAHCDSHTSWPKGFDPAAAGVRAEQRRLPRPSPSEMRTPRPGEILVVEDEPTIRKTICRQLESRGYGVATANNGREALEYLASHPTPSLILLDLSMPVLDGWGFRIEQQKDPRWAAVPVVITSAVYDPSPAAELARAEGFLAKPYDLEMVLATVRRFCT